MNNFFKKENSSLEKGSIILEICKKKTPVILKMNYYIKLLCNMFSHLFLFSYNRGKSIYEKGTDSHKKMLR